MSQEEIRELLCKLREGANRLDTNSEIYNEIYSLIIDIEQ